MASLDHRLNPLFSIKECMTCGALYTADFCCSKGGLEDKILVPKPPQSCATCGKPIDGLYCRHCVFVRKCLNEGLRFLNFFNDPRIIWEQRIAAYKGYRGGGLVQIGMKDTRSMMHEVHKIHWDGLLGVMHKDLESLPFRMIVMI
ncbi:hypothetical protein Tco_0018982 [Tanacetum coccineum]